MAPHVVIRSEDVLLAARLSRIEQVVEARRKECQVPGVALAIVQEDRVVFSKGLGMRDREGNRPMTPRTLLPIGSLTKSFTGLAALLAQERGRLALTDSPRKYLPYFQLSDPQLTAQVTLADLLTHRSGIMAYNDLPWYTGALNSEEVIRTLASAKPTAKRGERFQYSNVMYLVAGECIAAAEGWPYARLIRDRIFAPLGMHRSCLTREELRRLPEVATGYDLPEKGKPVRRLPPQYLTNVAPAGAIYSTLEDMTRWLRFVLSGGVLEGKHLLSEPGYRDWTSSQMAAGPGLTYGYGWALDTWRGNRQVWHSGGIDGFQAIIAILPEKRLGFVLLTNLSESALPVETRDRVFETLVGDSETPAVKTAVVALRDPDAASRKAGVYRLQKGSAHLDMTIRWRDGALFAQPQGQPEFGMAPSDDNHFTLLPPAPPNILLSFTAAATDPRRFDLVLEYGKDKLRGSLLVVETFRAPLSDAQLVQKMQEAYGGAKALRSHSAIEITYSMAMINQGITGEVQWFWRFPDTVAEVMELRALGRRIGRIHRFFDGRDRWKETTYSPPERLTESHGAGSSLRGMWPGGWEQPTLFTKVAIERLDSVQGEPVYVVRKTLRGGGAILDYVSTRSFLVRKREWSDDMAEVYSGYQKEGGISIPREIIRTDPAGTTMLKIKTIRFGREIPEGVFRNGYRRCRKV